MTTRYYSAYISSNGQPTNGMAYHSSKRAAVARARELARQNLIANSGGRAWAGTIAPREAPDLDITIWEWVEFAEGGFVSVPFR